MALAIDALLLHHLLLQAATLLGGVSELGAGVRELDPAGIELEALGQPGISCFRPGERGLHRRILVEDRCPLEPETWLDPFDQHAAENVAPGVVGGGADAGGMGRRSQARRWLRG